MKIDRSIVANAADDPGARAVLHGIAAFASEAGAFVIAEGIEDERTMALVQDLHEHGVRGGRVHGAQGFLLGRPAPFAAPQPA